MEITDYIVSRFKKAKGEGRVRLLTGVAGRAGAGKTTLVENLSVELRARGIASLAYSGDWRFIHDSAYRRRWLQEKWNAGVDAYLYALNQFSWWDFKKIHGDLAALRKGQGVVIDDAYDRKTGRKELVLELPAIPEGVILYENCILGGVEFLEDIDMVVLVNTPDQVCLERVLRKDAGRRRVPDIASRYLVTTYSENIFLKTLVERFSDRTVVCDSDGALGKYPEIHDVSYVPVPIRERRPERRRKGTVFCDLDGVLLRHVPVPSATGEDIEVLEGTVQKLKEIRDKGYLVILTTSRAQENVFGVLEKLRSIELEFDQIICDLPVGPRHLINDSKDGEIRAIAHALKRDAGIKDLEIP